MQQINSKKRRESKAGIKAKDLVNLVHSYSGLRVFTNSLLEEICFPLKANHFHPLERVANIVMSVATKVEKKSIGTEFDVIAHHGRVHSNEFDWKCIDDKLHFNVYRATDNIEDASLGEAVDQFGVHQACKVAVKAFVTAY